MWNTLATALAEDIHRDALVQRALATPLEGLASFLGYAKETMPAVWNTLATALAEDIHRDALVQRALATPLEHLASFLGYAEEMMPEVWRALDLALADASCVDALVSNAVGCSTGHLLGFLRYAAPENSELVFMFTGEAPRTMRLATALLDGLSRSPARERFIHAALIGRADEFNGLLAYLGKRHDGLYEACQRALADAQS